MEKKHRILLIDDSEATVEGLKCFLDQRYEVSTACNGLECLRVLEKNEQQPDLVITDLVMPLISGVGLISLLKKQSPEIPIIAMTGWGKEPSELAKEAKADKILIKPFDLEDLNHSVSELLAGKRSRMVAWSEAAIESALSINHSTIRIVIADDHESVRTSLHRLLKLQPRFEVVAEAENGSEALVQVDEHRPDVVLMDISMPVMNGIEATGMITSQFPGTKVIILTAHTEQCYLNRAYQAGAIRCLVKTCGNEELLRAIMDCSSGCWEAAALREFLFSARPL